MDQSDLSLCNLQKDPPLKQPPALTVQIWLVVHLCVWLFSRVPAPHSLLSFPESLALHPDVGLIS